MLLFSATVAFILHCVIIKLIDTASMKYILLWSHEFSFKEMIYTRSGQEAFIESQCPHLNCYITDNKSLFGVEVVTKFDAILFNGRNLIFKTLEDLPKTRLPQQKYIFVCTEAFGNTMEPICNPIFDGFFNLTATLNPNSDIVLSNKIVSYAQQELKPGDNMSWIHPSAKVNNSLRSNFKWKKKAVVWVLSHCTTKIKEAEYANKLKKILKVYDQTLDVYNGCGDTKCLDHINKTTYKCDNLLRNEYFFHLEFEDSTIKHHLRTKMLHLLQNDNVPIVYGGANYSSILPPGSYLDASNYTPERLASTIVYIINNPERYSDFFRYRVNDHQDNTYPANARQYLCTLCAALNNENIMSKEHVYWNFRSWWDPDYEENCKLVTGKYLESTTHGWQGRPTYIKIETK